MAIIVCPDCGKEQDNLNKFCRNCGADLSKVKVEPETNSDSSNEALDADLSQKSIDVPIQKEDGTNTNELVILDSEEPKEEAIEETIDESVESNETLKEEDVEPKESNVKKCSNCGTELKFGEKFCPNCGQSTDSINDDYPKNFCPNCGEKLIQTVKFCPNCGFDFKNISGNAKNMNNPQAYGQNLPVRKEPIVSVILSFVFPGLGQFYNGNSTKGIYFIILAVVSIVLTVILIGALIYILIWLWSIIDAYNSAEKLNRGEFVEDKLF